MGFCVKIVWTTLRKRSKRMFLQEKIVFSKRKTSKFSRLRRGYTPSNPKNFRACGAATQPIIQNIDDVVPKLVIQNIGDIVQKAIIQKQLFLMTLFKNNYSKRTYSKD